MRELFIRVAQRVTAWLGLRALLYDYDLLTCGLVDEHLSLWLMVVEELPLV